VPGTERVRRSTDMNPHPKQASLLRHNRPGTVSHMTIVHRTPAGTGRDAAFGQLNVSHIGCTMIV
jgi:hypothetical protein